MKIEAKIVADSLSPANHRLTTFVVTFPRIILAELNTHRVLSRNSASSRAIPFERMIEAVENNPFIPIRWMKDHKGMQGTEYVEDQKEIDLLVLEWLGARDEAVDCAVKLSELGVTKQICNRLLEPFMWHTAIITASEFENFFALRNHEAAEIHIAELARVMMEEYNNSTPKSLKEGEYHIPFGDGIDMDKLLREVPYSNTDIIEHINNLRIKISVSRCARISYTIVGEEGKSDNYLNDIKLHDRLLMSGHFSPFEHTCRCMRSDELIAYSHTKPKNGLIVEDRGWCGNIKGFIPYRKMLDGENKKDSRVIKKEWKLEN